LEKYILTRLQSLGLFNHPYVSFLSDTKAPEIWSATSIIVTSSVRFKGLAAFPNKNENGIKSIPPENVKKMNSSALKEM
jgi:hypothetical protein